MTRALIIEDHPLFGTALLHLVRSVLGVSPEFVISAEAGLQVLQEYPDMGLIIMDLGLPGQLTGQAAVRAIRVARADIPLLVVSGVEDTTEIDAALAVGATAYVSKRASNAELCEAILQALARPAPSDPPHLTERQREILRLLCAGLANKVIADQLGVTEATIKMHMTSVLRTLGVTTRTQAVLAAQRLGLA